MRIVRRSLLIVVLLMVALPSWHAEAQRRTPPRRGDVQRRTPRQWADTVRVAIDAATRAGGMRHLEDAMALMTRALRAQPDDALLRHYEGFLIYRMITVGGASMAPTTIAAYLDQARDALERSIARRPMAESYLLLSEVYSRQIAATPSRGGSLGPTMALARARAMSVGARNPRVYLLAGIAAMYAPPDAGGGLHAAEQLLRAAVSLFNTDKAQPPDPVWGRAEAYAWLGQVYERTGRKPQAVAAYTRALALEPDNAWVRDVLLPGVR